ncbi:mannose-6-phosphate isomerase [Novosphingobium sp. FSY-8]|uniref:Mannose-6-phosphate isomerase n=1 Tax=Novosphingobium ovatum TaxID=1908523 RepID=A0ABW9XEE3_9SPHN|nr:class I mannose-6-phosphate isomerase [Novosphingobium ovatum]NBC36905.1 mannose-6-phosphate isomerase [Novosphingobium ovatum]
MVTVVAEALNLPIRLVDKVWGCDCLPAPFVTPVDADGAPRRVGEIWFEPPALLPDLLIKYIFTSEKLSVQVHPSDAQTLAMGIGRQGKEECWLVVDAQPGATLGIGFDRSISTDEMRAAALDGRIEDMLVWHKVAPGDFFYIPANTVHAIGAGVSVIEVQQTSDITYRLYDYGRPRELHLDEGLAVALGQAYDLSRWHQRLNESGTVALVDGPHFRLDRVDGVPDAALMNRYGTGAVSVIPLKGDVALNAAGEARVIHPGECGVASHVEAIGFAEGGLCLIAQSLTKHAI